MRMLESKYIRFAAVSLAVILMLFGLWISHQSNQGETSSPSLAPSLVVNSDAKHGDSVQKKNEQLRTTATTSLDQVQNGSRFANAEELCADFASKNLGKLNADQFADALRNHIRGSEHAIEDWLRSVASTGSPRQKGAALSLLVAVTDMAIRKEAYARNPNCDKEKDCSMPLEEMVGNKTTPFAHALVNDAIYGTDPALYSMAHNICKRFSFSRDAVCNRVDAMQWLQRDPDNGAAALYALGEMTLPKPGEDATSFENALHRLSLAKRFELYFDVGSELPPLPSNIDDYDHRTQLEALRSYFWDISPLPPHRNIIPACAGDNLKSQNRRFTCELIANQYLRESAFLIDRAIFLKLAGNLTWDQTKLQKITEDVDAVNAYYKMQSDRVEKQAQDTSGRVKFCHQNLKRFSDTWKYTSNGEFKQYQQEAREFDVPREELIKFGRRMRESR